jgi:hypothetical protein
MITEGPIDCFRMEDKWVICGPGISMDNAAYHFSITGPYIDEDRNRLTVSFALSEEKTKNLFSAINDALEKTKKVKKVVL